MLLDQEELGIINKINEYIKLIAFFNKNEKSLTLDLEKLWINCKPYDNAGLLFKLKNENMDDIIKEKGKEKNEEYMINSIFKKIVPTFCKIFLRQLFIQK